MYSLKNGDLVEANVEKIEHLNNCLHFKNPKVTFLCSRDTSIKHLSIPYESIVSICSKTK